MRENWLNRELFEKHFLKVPVEEYPNTVKTSIPAPSVTVHLVTYNHKEYIGSAIEAILTQKTNFPFEIIIGDDQSTDGTREVCLQYAHQFPSCIRLMLHKRENNIRILGKPCLIFQYLYNSFHARGKYIAICSGDDCWNDEYKLQKQFDFLESHPEVNRTYTDHLIRYEGLGVQQPDEFAEGAASTWMYKNFFTAIPIEFTQMISEDSFIDFYLSASGYRKKTIGVEPVIVRRHRTNTYMTSGNDVLERQRINTIEKCISAFSRLEAGNAFKVKLVTKLIDKNRREAKLSGSNYVLMVYKFFRELIKFHLFTEFVRYFVFYRLLKVK